MELVRLQTAPTIVETIFDNTSTSAYRISCLIIVILFCGLPIVLANRIWQRPAPEIRVSVTLLPMEKAAMGPFFWLCHQSVTDWIVMDIIQVALKIDLVADDMIPKTFLPELHLT
jgi:hypothetical protein